MADPAPIGGGVIEDPHAPEVDLELLARLTVRDAHGCAATPAGPAQLGAVALEGARRDADPLAGEQGVDLGDGQSVLVEPFLDGFSMGLEPTPGRPVAVNAMRPDPLEYLSDEHVAQLGFSGVALEAQLARCLHVAPDGLAVDADQLLDRAQPLAAQPEPEHLFHLVHGYLPESHRRSSDPLTVGGECTGSRTGAGGSPGVVPLLAEGWSHGGGGTQLKVVPSRWRATCSVSSFGRRPPLDKAEGSWTADTAQTGRWSHSLRTSPGDQPSLGAGWDEDQRWTLARTAALIARLFHVRYTLRGVSYLLHRIGFSPQVPAHRAAERDEAAIAAWRATTWAKVRG